MEQLKNIFSQVYNQPYTLILLLLLGFLTLARFVYQTLSVLLQIFVVSGKSLKRFGAKDGTWAVITGASDGIGKEFAFQLAEAGFNVFLVARNKESLQSAASDIALRYPTITTAHHCIDFSENNSDAYQALATVLNSKKVGVLVNNVGRSHSMPVYFYETPDKELADIVSINVNATLRVTHAVLPGMIQNKRGLILNIGSFAGSVPSPMLATYSGTKAFLSTFTSALAAEVAHHNILVEHVNTYYVVSKLSKIRRPSLFIPQPKVYVRSVLSRIGLACGAGYSGHPASSTPYWSHALLDYAMTVIGLPSLFVNYTLRSNLETRRRVLKKQEREAKKL